MTSLAQVTALVDAHVNRDHVRFRAITLQIAAHLAARSERGADQLRKLVDQPPAVAFVPLPSASGLFSVPADLSSLEDMVISAEIRDRLDRVVLEYAQREVLFVHNLRPARKLLFTGDPGVGKTMAAGALARAIGLPLFRVELHEVISSHLGETSGKLAKVFDHVRSMPAVYLFDEFDAIGSDRSALSDGSSAGSEMRRVVNALLQFIEVDRSEGLIVAATNHGADLDGALFRRFDETIAFEIPSRAQLVDLVRRSLVESDLDSLDFDKIYAAAANPRLGHADVCAALDRVLKDHFLVGTAIDTDHVVEAISRRTRLVRAEIAA